MIPSDPATPGPGSDDDRAAGGPPRPPTLGDPPPSAARPGADTFTIDGRRAPALFVVGWLATLVGGGTIGVALLSGGSGAAPILLVVGMLALGVGLVAGAGSQAIERRSRGDRTYAGPSPLLVFAASIPWSVLAIVVVGIPLALAGLELLGPVGRLASVAVQASVYIGLIRLLVVDTGALSWRAMGVRRPDGAALRELATGALWAAPVILVTIPIAGLLSRIFPVSPVSPLPPTGEATGFLIHLLAGAIVAPIGEEILFRGFATTAWAADLGPRRGLIRAALLFAVAHVLTITGATFGEAFGLVVLGFATRVPIALALGWLFLRSGSIWAPLGLHATFNAILLVIAEVGARA